jgi:hypothetical protein
MSLTIKSHVSHRNTQLQNSTNLTVDGYSTQAQVSHYHNGFHTSYGFPDLIHLQPTESIYIQPIQGLKLKCRSISGLEPEVLVTTRSLET